MRFVDIDHLEEGMIVGKDIVDLNGNILLRAGVVLNDFYIERLKEKKFNGIYIEDEISYGIIPSDVIPQQLKLKMMKILHLIAEKELSYDSSIEEIKKVIIDVVEELTRTDAYLNIVELKSIDEYLYSHSVNTTLISLLIGIEMKLNKNELYNLGMSALLHDIGKKFIGQEILNKPGKLTEEEFEKVKMHPIWGYKYAKDMGFSLLVCSGIIDHHEKYNGEGYPNKKKGKQISLYGRIISVADVYDALISTRTYRKAFPPHEAFEYIISQAGIHFDNEVVNGFMHRVFPYPVGTIVQLSNGMVGIVVRNHRSFPLRPDVKVLKIKDDFVDEPYLLELTKNLNITILSSLNDFTNEKSNSIADTKEENKLNCKY
ncbi:metal dependent phosphohydrolase [Caldicellulosiruptor hydrothermalis 108]|uniref:Metal dependent phosphohydrolase n=1 Tax=Caldicellulosiruptor hydrothermalis (strain DSM 18901 / VKM B-2411 / 108) TaxID=632292 RepID=E4Q7F5_CALH1|nr:HD-GYP domain-containing protein [Caldicellulosiruptor hydrothermalis]ADQ07800.1 metal dependent phosphohydrolase [Caldicellulosiruptor hydrothermalis 108]